MHIGVTRTGLSNGWSVHDGNAMPAYLGCGADPYLANLTGDPRWSAFLRAMGLADDQLKLGAR